MLITEIQGSVEKVKEQLEQNQQRNSKRSKENTWDIIHKKKAKFETEIEDTKWIVSLVCPISKTRMRMPCRSSKCDHIQCFDREVFLSIAKKQNHWKCPLCLKPLATSDLRIDTLLEKVIANSPATCKQIEFKSDGSWMPVVQNCENIVIDLDLKENTPEKLKSFSPIVIVID
ncbi:E3 SUMO-protein ligase PIAS1-like protein [Leptotrombidium deliense]|uniref:E3 SUMO-protein ligase PIAS1-like protein n=1 Tax=Leptotrombidium deliense TaxID=299467 RepID=A0A443SGJ0_9ACAR|nr:E3 SUMO-protein ligase PIAS1-like protein [Leptotrombidium deliense]